VVSQDNALKGIAVIGMAGRFPGAKNVDQFWHNLCNGVESISFFSNDELINSGVDPAVLSDRNYVKARAVLDDIDMLDAAFFGFTPKEAAITDPQHRLFLECAWEALENAGYDPKDDKELTGIYAGTSLSSYLIYNLLSHPELNKLDSLSMAIGNEKDYLPTRVSYKLNLKGPSIGVNTACSTSLVAVHLACRGLLSYQCDKALAGGVTIETPHKEGYFYTEGGITSPDGHCRAFDAKAKGCPSGNGVGIVVLKRLEDALVDGDRIYAVIKGSAINNDGSEKVSFTAPSVAGQAEVIAEAQAIAGFEPETFTYIEAHGTGTALGDPIEIRALKKAFSTNNNKKNFCAIGSVKTNVSHLNVASGVTGLIKTALALKHKQIPPSLYFEAPNPEIDFANSPFYVNTQLCEWETNGIPRRAGVSSFGLGGTNAHVVLEEALIGEQRVGEQHRKYELLVLSTKTESALETATANLINHLQQHPELNLADVAYTLQVGRHPFTHRRTVVCQDIPDAIIALQSPQRVLTNTQETNQRPIAFMFTGLGTQYIDMAEELYQVEPIFREHLDRCFALFQPLLGIDLKQVIYPPSSASNPAATKEKIGINLRQMLGRDPQPIDPATEKLNQTYLTQPALFAVEYALAQLWMSWGIRPAAMIGYSIGEYVAATLAGVLSLEDAIALVAARAQMIQKLPGGAMLAVPLTEQQVQPYLNENLSLSAVNGAFQCVLAGTTQAVEELSRELNAKGLACRQLQTSHAFHSFMMGAIADSFTQLVQTINLQPPQIPYLSNVTGTWITTEQATNPSYWTQHLCQPVRFADGLQQLWKQHSPILLEVGAGQALSSLARQCLDNIAGDNLVVLSSLRYAYEQQSDIAFILNTLGQLWLEGVKIDWSGFHTHERRYRLPLPTYPFERQRYWIEPQKLSPVQITPQTPSSSGLWQSLVEASQLQASIGAANFDEQIFHEKKEWRDRLCIAYIHLALSQLGAFSHRDKKYSLEELLEECQIIPPYKELLSRWLEILVEQGKLNQEQELFTNLSPISAEFVNQLLVEVKAKWRDTPQQIDLLQLYGENMVALLTGEKEPLEFHVSTLLKEGEFSVQELPEDRYYNSIMRVCLEQVLKALPSDINLRILEIGGGTGTGTADLLPILPPQRTKYTFTDVGSFFLNTAKKKFSDYPFVEYQLLDLERSPQEQGYSSYSFDVIVAFQVLHVAKNIGQTLDRLRSLLAPGGLLLFWETTQPRLEFEFIDALLMNPIEDSQNDRNMCNPFLSKEKWEKELKSHGFEQVIGFSEFAPFTDHVILAQATASAAFTEKNTVHKANLSTHHSRPNLKNAYAPPTNELEQKLVEVYQELLGIEQIGIHDSFFALGGDSLTGTVLISQLRTIFQIELPVRLLFEAPTIAEFALVIEEIFIEELEEASDLESTTTSDMQLSK
jgi:acyl transferase domain-containing protein/SAM-dependent methyltransferase